MKNIIRKIKGSFFICGHWFLLSLVACNSEPAAKETQTLLAANPAVEEIIRLSASQFQGAQMELGKIQRRSFSQALKTSGMLDVPPENRAFISAYFGGYVKEISLLPGQAVKKGQLLFTLENPDYVQVQQEFLEAKGQLNYLKSDYERQKELIKENIASQKNFLKAEADYQVTLARFESLKKKLSLMHINPASISPHSIQSTIAVTAPISGYVTSVHAVNGMFLNPAVPALTITRIDNLHLELNIFEQDLPLVHIGQAVRFHLQNNPAQQYEAEVSLINKSIEQEKRTVSVHAHLKEEEERNYFTPGMYVEAEILVSADTLFSLPEEAVVAVENTSYVLEKQNTAPENYTFEKKEVQAGPSQNGYVPILNRQDFNEDTEFLTKGAFNLIKE